MAEMSVPAWPMPIHQTKLMMPNPQATGVLGPQMPIPRRSRLVIETIRTRNRKKPMPKPMNHASGVRRRSSTIALILSVIEPKVCPGPMSGGRAGGSASACPSGVTTASPWRVRGSD